MVYVRTSIFRDGVHVAKAAKVDRNEAAVAADPVDAPDSAVLVVGLTERERLFAEAFFEVALEQGTDVGASKLAYRRAFPNATPNDSGLTSMASALVRNERVRQHVAWMRQQYSARMTVPVDRVKEEIERIAFANILDLMVIDEKGVAQFDLRGLRSRTASAIAEITVDEREIPMGKDGPVVLERKIKVKMHSKMDALDKLARIHGIYQDKLNVTFTLDELDNAIAMMEAKLEAKRLQLPPPDKRETMQ